MLAVGRLGELPEVVPDRAPLALPEDRLLARVDVDAVRFSVGLRGYRMTRSTTCSTVSRSRPRERDARIDELETRLAARGVPRPDPEA